MKNRDKITRVELKKLMQEIFRFQEDALLPPPEVGEPHYLGAKVCPSCGEAPCTCDDQGMACPACGMSPCQCVESPSYRLACSECGSVMVMQESCGCAVAPPPTSHVIDMQMDQMCPSCGVSPCECASEKHHSKGAYMFRSQLRKIEKYARELQAMIPEGYDLDDWMRSHISQASDDLSEVYHKMEYKTHSE